MISTLYDLLAPTDRAGSPNRDLEFRFDNEYSLEKARRRLDDCSVEFTDVSSHHEVTYWTRKLTYSLTTCSML